MGREARPPVPESSTAAPSDRAGAVEHVRDEKRWRRVMRHLTGKNAPLHRRTPQDLALLLERQDAGCKVPLTAEQVLQMIHDGTGELVASRSAVAFVVDHGADAGVELRYLFVMPGQRKRGAGQALVARLRARYANLDFFCTFQDGHWARFVRLNGLEPRQQSDGSWHVATAPAALQEDPALGLIGRPAARPSPLATPAPRAPPGDPAGSSGS